MREVSVTLMHTSQMIPVIICHKLYDLILRFILCFNNYYSGEQIIQSLSSQVKQHVTANTDIEQHLL